MAYDTRESRADNACTALHQVGIVYSSAANLLYCAKSIALSCPYEVLTVRSPSPRVAVPLHRSPAWLPHPVPLLQVSPHRRRFPPALHSKYQGGSLSDPSGNRLRTEGNSLTKLLARWEIAPSEAYILIIEYMLYIRVLHRAE